MERAEVEVEQLQRRHVSEQLQRRHVNEQQQLQLEQLDQLKAFKEQLLCDLFTQLSPQPRPPIQSLPPQPNLPLPYKPSLPHSSLPPCTLSSDLPPATADNPSSTVGSRGASISPSVTPVTPSPVPHHTSTSTQQSPLNSLLPHSPHQSSPNCEVSMVKTSTLPPPPTLPHSPPPHTPPSWSLAQTLVLPQTPPQKLRLSTPSPQGRAVLKDHPNSFQENTHSFDDHTQYPVRPLPRPAWMDRGETTPNQYSDTRATLSERHSRHTEYFNSYYKSQMPHLQTANQHPSNVSPPSNHAFSPVYDRRRPGHPSPLSPVLADVSHTQHHQRAYTQLTADNERLKAKCTDLESQLQQSSVVNRALEKQLEKQKEYWLEWQAQAEMYSQTIGVLQDKLESSRTQLKQQDSIVEQLQADLQMSVGEIQFWKEQQAQESVKFKQLCEELQTKNKRLESYQEILRDELSSARRELGKTEAATKASAAEKQELKSTIQKLEDRVRHLEHVNNRLHGQATHYSLGSAYPNSPDDDKFWRWPTSATGTLSSSHTLASPPPLRNPHTSSPPQTPPSTHHQASHSSKSLPLNRRKWLEPSDPGLILGTPPPSLPHSPPHPPNRGSHTHYHSDNITSSPLLQSTGQAIARQQSDSSNEGEDPTSLTKQSYMNTREGDGEYSSLVASTLSAIQRGRIRTDTATGGKSRKDVEKESVEERVRRNLRVVAEAEEKLATLRKEKENLESQLQRTPRHGNRVTRHSKQAQLEMEERLEVVLKEIGSVKMTLRSHHAFHK